jgi:hypothetical protein
MERSEVRRRIEDAIENACEFSDLTGLRRTQLANDVMLIVDEVIESETEPIAQES